MIVNDDDERAEWILYFHRKCEAKNFHGDVDLSHHPFCLRKKMNEMKEISRIFWNLCCNFHIAIVWESL